MFESDSVSKVILLSNLKLILHSFMSNWLCTSSCNPNLGLVFVSELNILSIRSKFNALWPINTTSIFPMCHSTAYDRGSNLNCQKILRPHKTVVLQTSQGPLLSIFSLHFPSNFQTFFFVQFFICTSVCLLSADFLICKLTNPSGVGAWPSRSRTCCSLPDLRGNVFAQENWILCLILILFLTL